MWFEYSESGISGILVLNILKKEAIVKHVSTQVFDNCKILIWNLSAWNVIWVLRIWNFWDVGTQYFKKKRQLLNMLVLRWMIIAKYQFEIWALEMWFEYSESGIFWMLVLNILKKKRQLWNMLVLRWMQINCKILIWNLSAWNVIWVLRIWNFWDVGTQYFLKRCNCETC